MAHGVSIELGFVQNVFLTSGLVECYSKNGFLISAERCFEENCCLDSVVWNPVINGYVWNNEFGKAQDV